MLAKEILLRAKKNIFTSKAADSLSKMRGEGLDFCEIRPYQLGDDIRKINHKASSKTGELQTNVFNENKQLSVVINIILSASLFFGTKKLKTEIIAEIIAALSFSSLQQKNHTKIVFFQNNKQKIIIIKNSASILEAINYILDINLLGVKTDFYELNKQLIQEKKSLMFILSDFYEYFELTAANKHQVNAIIVRDKFEEFPNFSQELSLINPENNNNNKVIIDKKLAQEYQKLLKLKDEKIYLYFRKSKINFGKIYSCDDAFLRLKKILR